MKLQIALQPALWLIASGLGVATPGLVASRTIPTHSIMLRDPRDIADAVAVHSAYDALLNSARSCTQTDMRAHMACECSLKAEITALKKAYRSALAKHPSWSDPAAAVTYVDPKTGTWTGVLFPEGGPQPRFCAAQ